MPEKKKAKDGQILGLQQENVLEAVVVADSFDSRFFPVTSNQPKVSYKYILFNKLVKYLYNNC